MTDTTVDSVFSLCHPSTGMADWIEGTLELDGLDHEARILRLHALLEVYKTILTCGDLEHTGDWDWRIEVVWGEAEITAGTYDVSEDEYVWSDTASLNYTVQPDDYLSHFRRWHYLAIEEFRGADQDSVDVLVPIDEIRRVTIGRA